MKLKIDDEILEDITDEEENIYQKLARATARAVDINLGKTTLADLLDGYTNNIVLQDRIDKAIEYIKENSYIVQDKEINGIPLMSKRLDKCDDLLEILGDKENE